VGGSGGGGFPAGWWDFFGEIWSVAKGNVANSFYHMTAIALELDRKLQTLDASTAASVERLVLDALELVDQRKKSTASAWPDGFWSQIRDDFGTEGFERPPQGEFEKSETW